MATAASADAAALAADVVGAAAARLALGSGGVERRRRQTWWARRQLGWRWRRVVSSGVGWFRAASAAAGDDGEKRSGGGGSQSFLQDFKISQQLNSPGISPNTWRARSQGECDENGLATLRPRGLDPVPDGVVLGRGPHHLHVHLDELEHTTELRDPALLHLAARGHGLGLLPHPLRHLRQQRRRAVPPPVLLEKLVLF
uniref:Uncharacterized protein n=1 Tax=Ananas comosus var. bracteatus TaxID=296719 RepID=A0A6V7QBT4_ANACO|nr:unnamed protein product [Ananas comosus var. bracteatus]